LVIVGPRWLGAGRGGTRRIDDETDFVRLEVETALSNAVRIIPVLVQGEALVARNRTPMQRAVNLKLEQLRYLVRLATDLKFLDPRRYEHAARAIDEIGRLVGGWLRLSRAAEAP
jgi:hypothetical protein